MKILLMVLQLLISALLLMTSIGKLLDNRGFANVLLTYKLFPDSAVLVLGLCFSLFELFLSIWIFSGIKLKYSSLCAFQLHALFLIIAIISNLRNLEIQNCGCFGVFWGRSMNWGTVVEDFILSTVCMIFYLLARQYPDRIELKINLKSKRWF